jgi:hypothetical protein
MLSHVRQRPYDRLIPHDKNPTYGLQKQSETWKKMDTLDYIGLYTAEGYKHVNLQHLQGTTFI